ncbi:MAG TPA: VTT domain-containing protein [Vicinamibacteria bacterium]|nr:VTT domain-containing protein [Vicinamibacteria bacterium]
MHKAMLWIQGVVIPALGPPGLFLVAVLDSSFLSIPEVNDLLVVTSASAHPSQAWLYILMATLGSVVGCGILWWIGRRGGQALLERKFGAERVARTRALFSRWGVLALAIPSMLPPPMPFKVFVLSSGVFGMPWRRFMVTLLVARGLRYTFWGTMGALYGREALALLQRFDAWFAGRAEWLLFGTALALVAFAGYWVLRRRRAPVEGV